MHKNKKNERIIEELQISNERSQSALNIYNNWVNSNGKADFYLYYSPEDILDEISLSIINKKTSFGNSYKIYDLKREYDYMKVLNTFQNNAESGGAYSRLKKDEKDVKEAVWKTIIAVTGIGYSLNSLKKKSYEDIFIQSFMNQYKWYYFKSHYMYDIAWDVGIIALYPDSKTFSLLIATDTD